MTRMTFSSITKVPYGKTSEEHRAYMKWWRSMNREEYNRKRLEWANGKRERRTLQARRSHLKSKFGLSLEDFDVLLAKQGGRCAICNALPKERVDKIGRRLPHLHVDHCHQDGRVRGILCHGCNVSLGHLRDDVELLKKMIEYLEDDKLNI